GRPSSGRWPGSALRQRSASRSARRKSWTSSPPRWAACCKSPSLASLPSPLRRQLALLRRAGSFRLLFVAALGSGVGTWMATIALAQDVKDRTGSTWWVSALFIVTFLPSIVVGLAAGPLIDRLSRKRLVIAAALARLPV